MTTDNIFNLIGILLQISGGTLLVITAFRGRQAIINAATSNGVIVGKKCPNLERTIYETYISRFGFAYLVLGYIIQFIGLFILPQAVNIKNWIIIVLSIILLAILLILGFKIPIQITKKILPQIELEIIDKAPNGAMRVEIQE